MPCSSAAALSLNLAMIDLLQINETLTAELAAIAAPPVKPASSGPYAGPGPGCQNCGE